MLDWLRGKNKQGELTQVQEQVPEQSDREKSIKEIELETFINKLVIVVSNEVSNITVGYGKEIYHITKAKIPMLVIHDIVNKEDLMPLGKMFDYTEQKFNALNKLEPNERIALFYDFGDHTVDKKPRDGDIIYPAEVWAEKVNAAIAEWKNQQIENAKPKKNKP
jgi:hypothetical protein